MENAKKLQVGQRYKLKWNKQIVRVCSFDWSTVWYQIYDQNGVVGMSVWPCGIDSFFDLYKKIK